jgi:cytidine deaminase
MIRGILVFMKENKYEFTYEVYNDSSELNEKDAWLLNEARNVTAQAYAPYSNFNVGAVAMLENGEVVAGTNQENASYPVGICAERVLLGSVATLHPKIPIHTIAISYSSDEVRSDHPISPCGMCRQALLEYESRTSKPIRLILGGQEGKVYVIKTAKSLLPFAFTSEELK